MPYLNIKISGDESQELSNQVAKTFLENTTNILGKKPEVTSIAIEYIKSNNWFIGKEDLETSNGRTFFCDIKITEGTNTKNQKQTYIKKCFEDMNVLLNGINEASYIVIDDVKGDSWGFSSKTQEYRYIQSLGV